MNMPKLSGSKNNQFLVRISLAVALGSTFQIAHAQRPGQFEAELQGAMKQEAQAKITNTPEAWRSAGTVWLAHSLYGSNIQTQQNSEGASLSSRNRALSVAITKRALACFVRAYEAEGPHDTQTSRQLNTNTLNSLLSAYHTLRKLEPLNARWPYLEGEALSAQGSYEEASSSLKLAARLGGEGGMEAQKLIVQVKPYLDQQILAEKRLKEAQARVARALANSSKPRQINQGGLSNVVTPSQSIYHQYLLRKKREGQI